MTAELTGTSTLIAGGTGAMGAALAQRIIDAGGEVVLTGRDAAKLAGTAARFGATARTIAADLTDAAQAERVAGFAGQVDHVVIAMSSGRSDASSIPATDLDGFKSAYSRLWASYNLLHLAPSLVAPTGSITMLSGSSGRRPGSGFGVWSALHGSIEALARAATIELAPMRVNVVSPGGIGLNPDRQLIEHAGAPDDIARAIYALITNPAITGAVLDVDGGERLGAWSGEQGGQT